MGLQNTEVKFGTHRNSITGQNAPDFFQDAEKLTRILGWLGCFCLVYVSYFFLSGLNAPVLRLDASEQAVLEYAFQHHFQFGRDIDFTFGPLGFLETIFSRGYLIGPRVAFALFWSGVVALSATGMARSMSGWARYVFLAWFVMLAVSAEFDQMAFFVMAYGTVVLLEDDRKRRWQIPVFCLVFMTLSLVKFTFLVTTAGSLCIIVGVRLLEKRIKEGLIIAAGACAAFVASWVALGQSITNIPNWIRQSLEFVSGYSAAMSLSPKGSVLSASVLALFLFFWAGALIIRGIRLQLTHIGVLLMVGLYVFMAWKEGFVRGDDHVLVFIFFLPLASGLFMHRMFWESLTARSQSKLYRLYGGIVVLCLAAAYFQIHNLVIQSLNGWPSRVKGNLVMIGDAMEGRAGDLYAARRNPALDREPTLARAKAAIGNGTVDVMNFLQWAALANRMNYRPRPVIQGYAAFTPELQELDAAYFRSPDRPDFVLLSQGCVDGKFPTLEDSAALNYVLANYEPILRDGDFLVMRQARTEDLHFQLVHEQTLRFGEKLDVSQWTRGPLFMSVSIQPSLLGRALGFIYQRPPMYIRIFRGTNQTRYRFVPEMAELPFLLSPALDNNDDVLKLYTAHPANAVDGIIFERSLFTSRQFQGIFNVRLYTASGFPMSLRGGVTQRMLADMEGFPFWPEPISIESWAPHNLVDFFGTPGMLVHAAGKVVLPIPGGATSFSGFFGLLPGAYTGEGKTDGVEFSIDAQDKSGRPRRIFDRLVRPLTQAGDRGRLSFKIGVNSINERKLILTTGVGPTGRNNWDWSVWSDCRFAGEKTRE